MATGLEIQGCFRAYGSTPLSSSTPTSMAFDRKAYMVGYMLRFRRKRRAEALALLGGRCKRCGSDTDLEFDHIEPDTKLKAVTRLYNASSTIFWAEVKKCQLLCGPCHRLKTHGELPARAHGTRAMYKGKCRCVACKAFGSILNANRRARHASKKEKELAMAGQLSLF